MRRPLFVVIALILSIFGAPPIAQAAVSIPLQITPARIPVTLTPGKLLVGEIEVANKSADRAFQLSTSVQDLRMTGLSGEFAYALESSPLALHHHVRLSNESFSLGPGEAKKIAYQVLLPKSAPPGGYYGVIFVRTSPAALEGTGSAISGQVGSLLLFDVAGEVDDRGRLDNLRSRPSGDKRSFTLTFSHPGRLEGTPRGAITAATGEVDLYTWYGRKIDTVPLTATYLLPEAKREVRLDWHPPQSGVYRAVARVQFAGHPQVTRSTVFLHASSRLHAALIVFGSLGVYLLYRSLSRIFPRRSP